MQRNRSPPPPDRRSPERRVSSATSISSLISRASRKNKLLPKISRSCLCSLRSGPDEGRTRRHETLGRQCGGREGISALHARTNDALADVKSRGPDTPKLVSPRRRARSASSRTVANKPGAPRRSRISAKTAAQGMPDEPALPVVPAACIFFAGGPWVRPSPGIPCALITIEGGRLPHLLGAIAPRDGARAPGCLTRWKME